MFRMFQGWMSMSRTGPYEGTLLVNPLLSHATAYYLLRPFFSPRSSTFGAPTGTYDKEFLDPANWQLDYPVTSQLQGANPSHCQELNSALHPHLNLETSMVHVPQINPGDYVVWHCDTIHAVDKLHAGKADSSVLYIPVCPLTETNVHYLGRQREAFLDGTPGPDFPGGKGESEHVGRPSSAFVKEVSNEEGLRAFGLARWDDTEPGLGQGQREALKKANEILGF